MADRGFSKKDETLVELLMGTWMPKNVAKTLAFLRKKEETTSVEIEISTALRQPEVSIAMQELRRRKWVIKRDIKKEGKGRPVHAYKLGDPVREDRRDARKGRKEEDRAHREQHRTAKDHGPLGQVVFHFSSTTVRSG